MREEVIPDWELGLLWLELTGRCQLQCVHCYAMSGPNGNQGEMSTADWRVVIDQAAQCDFRRVTFIGGEPTLHHDLPDLVDHSIRSGLQVSIYSNLVRLPPDVWRIASNPAVRLYTSYYSSSADQHDAITGVRGSHALTTASIEEAVTRGIGVHAALISVASGQDVRQAGQELRRRGARVSGAYLVRPVGRAVGLKPSGSQGITAAAEELCGRCGFRTVAVDPDGFAYPCVFARKTPVGNVRDEPLDFILTGSQMCRARRTVRAAGEETVRPRDYCAP
jgi:MoaA/NifB/PqqE/SkfB family radical SAM enzyme